MATRDDVRVKIGGDLSGLKGVFTSAQGLTNRFAQGAASALKPLDNAFGGMLSNLFSVRGAIATLAGTGGLGLLIRSSIETASRIADTADKIGLGVEALQEYRYAAQLSGVQTDTLDMAMQRFSRRFAEAAQGGGELKDTLIQYGIAVKNADGSTRDLESVLADYADAVAGAGNAQEQLRLAFKGFDSEGAALVNMLRNGSAGIAKLRAEARELGVVLDADLVRQAEEAGDQLDRMGTIIRTNLTRSLLDLIPLIGDVGSAVATAAREFGLFWQSFLPRDRKTLGGLQEELANLQRSLQRELDFEPPSDFLDQLFGADEARAERIAKLRAEIAAVEALIAGMQAPEPATGGGLLPTLDETTSKVHNLFEALQFELEQLQRTTAEQELYNRAKSAGIGVTDDVRATLLPAIEMLELETAALEADTKAAQERERELEKLKSASAQVFEATRTPVERYQAEIQKLNRLLELHRETLGEAGINWDTYARAVEAAQDELDKATGKIEDADKTAKDLGLTFESAFENAVVEGEKLRDVLQGLADDIIRIATRMMITEPLGNLFTGIFSSFDFGSIFGGSDFAGATAAARSAGAFPSTRGNVFRGSILSGPIVPHARGGVLTSPIAFPMSGGRTGTAAENGAEAIMPLARDSQGRLGVRASGGEGGGINVVVNDYRQRGEPVQVRESQGLDGRRQLEIAIHDVVNQGIRSGRYDTQLGRAFSLRRGGGVTR